MLKRCHTVVISLCCVFMLTGCRAPTALKEHSTARLSPYRIAGRVETVNQKYRYLILRCSVAPLVGVEASVYRDHKKVAQVRFSSVRDYPCVSADILSGQPERDDLLVY